MKFLVILLFVTVANGLRLQLFKGLDYHELKGDFNLSANEEKSCITTKYPDELRVGSLKTDKCLIIYRSLSCKVDEGEAFRVEKDTPEFHANWVNNNFIEFGSFHVCSQKLGGGPLLDVDFYGEKHFKGDMLILYRNICRCQNIPESYTLNSSHIMSVNNYGNGVAVFEKENCELPYFYIPPGGNMLSNTITTCIRNGYLREIMVRSFYPMGTINCIRLNASVVHFDFKNSSTSDSLLDYENVTISRNTGFRNVGATNITELYTVTKRIKVILEFTKPRGFSNVHIVEIGTSIKPKLPFGLPSIGLSFHWQGIAISSTDAEKRSLETEEIYTVSQPIEIPPCTEYHVSSFLKMMKQHPIEYTAFARLTGKADDEIMSKNELKLNIGNEMEFVRDLDDYAIEVAVKGQILATHGVQTIIVGKGHPIKGCLKNTDGNNITSVNGFVIELPVAKD